MKGFFYTFRKNIDMVRKILFALTSLALLQANAQQLDLGFGINGKVMTSFGSKPSILSTIALQPDGKILACGSYFTYTTTPFFVGNEVALSRYNSDGSPDLDFGVQGRIIIPIGSNNDNEHNVVKVLDDGKILILANNTVRVSEFVTTTEYALIKYHADGTSDTGFGNNGIVSVRYEGHLNWARSMIVQPDNKIVLVGHSEQISVNDYGNFVAVRLHADGTKDSSFGVNGRVDYNVGAGSGDSEDASQSLVLQPDGKIVIAGGISTSLSGGAALMRLNTDGTPDLSFGNNGRAITIFGSYVSVTGLLLLPDGHIIGSGVNFYNGNSNEKIIVFKCDANGSPDVTFGSEGKVIIDGGNEDPVFFSLASILQDDGKILVSGWGNKDDHFDAFVIKLNADGSIDANFGDNGYLWTGFGLDMISNDLLLQPDGKLLVGGTAFDSENSEFALWRYENSNLNIPSFKESLFAVAPNPFRDFITIKNTSKQDQPQSAILSDLSGRIVTSMVFHQTTLNENVRMPMPESLPKGVYILTISNNRSATAIKIVK